MTQLKFNLEIERVSNEIKKSKAKKVCLQLPDGLKLQATKIVDQLRKSTNAEIYTWFGSNFGACDIPIHLKNLKFDLVVNFSHSKI